MTFTPQLVNTLQEAAPGLVLVDLDGPNAGGIELISSLKGNAKLRNVPVVAMCREKPDSVKQEILDAFSVPCVIRPFDLASLAACLD